METQNKTTLTVETTIHVPVAKVWQLWNKPEHITKWYNPSDDWHTPRAENDLVKGGKFLFRMEARDGSAGFDFGGAYNEVDLNKQIAYTIGDGRKVKITFTDNGNQTRVVEIFETENDHSMEMQRGGWQAILDNFKSYAESREKGNIK